MQQSTTAILLGNLNYRIRLPHEEMFERIQRASIACQINFEAQRESGPSGAGLEWCWRQGAGYNRFWTLHDPEVLVESPLSGPLFLQQRHSSDAGGGHCGDAAGGGWGVGLADITEGVQHLGQHPCDDQGSEGGAAFGPPQPLEEAWAWVKEKDVLSQRMARGLLLHGFREAPIAFPPTFKWRIEASAEDYTERRVLEEAYVTRPRRAKPTAYPMWSPSYTDRIMVHSLDDIAHRLCLGPYDMCDKGPLAQISDHRPVSLALCMLVDVSQLPSIETLGQPSSKAPSFRASSDTANAMAMAAMQAHEGRQHRRSLSFSRLEQVLTRQPSPGPRTFPLLVCMAFSRFRFNFRGFEVLRDEERLGAGSGQLSYEEKEGEEEVKDAQRAKGSEREEGEQQPQEPPPLPTNGSTTAFGEEQPRAKRSLRLPSLKTSGRGGAGMRRREGRAAAVSQRSESDLELSIIDHVLILYPLPCG